MDYKLNTYVPDFIRPLVSRTKKNGINTTIITVDFSYLAYGDVVIKGGEVIGWWNGEKWSLGPIGLIAHIDAIIYEVYNNFKKDNPGHEGDISLQLLQYHSSGMMKKFDDYVNRFKGDSNITFNNRIFFEEDVVSKTDYSTYKLPYTPKPGSTESFDKLFNVLYAPEELDKILWSMGALFTGDISNIHKFLFIYGPKGSGKSTILNVLSQLIGDYQAPIDLRAFTGSSEFATADVKEVPVLVDTDSDLSHINNEQNLLKLTAHEPVMIRKLYKQGYPVTFNGLLITASNERFRLNNSDSGIVRRALVVSPTRNKVAYQEYRQLMNAIKFELPAIAYKCIEIYQEMGAEYYADDVDTDIIEYSDKVFKFVREYADILSKGIGFKQAVAMFETFLEEIGWNLGGVKRKLESDLGIYFNKFEDKHDNGDGSYIRNYYSEFLWDKAFPERVERKVDKKPKIDIRVANWLDLNVYSKEENVFDVECADYQAQLTTPNGTPKQPWDKVSTTLKDINPTELHFVRLPEEHIVLDFDLKNEKGEKDLNLNLAKASLYPETYMEVSKSGAGVHLHYIYDGDVTKLADEIEPDVEIKVFTGRQSLRRKYSKSNGKFIAHISSGLPLKKKETKMYSDVKDIVWTEETLNKLIDNCLEKKHHVSTRQEINFIHDKIIEAKEQGLKYNLQHRYMQVLEFAQNSTNQYEACSKIVYSIPWVNIDDPDDFGGSFKVEKDEDLYFFDLEVYPNLNIMCWAKYDTSWKGLTAKECHAKMFSDIPDEAWTGINWTSPDGMYGVWYNPDAIMVAGMIDKALIGYNSLGYDNHILYGMYSGSSAIEIYNQSQQLINGDRTSKNTGRRSAAYGLGYADLYEMMDIRKSLKEWEIILGWPHDEFEFPWDKPLAKENWGRAAKYCMNDVGATQYTWRSKFGQSPYTARKILCELTGKPIITKTQQLAAAFIFDGDMNAKNQFNWYDLSSEFPGYTFDKFRKPKSLYMDDDPSEGGYVYANPGVYEDVIVLDIASMHPSSLIAMNYFGKYTPRYAAIKDMRVAIKNGDMDKATHMFDDIDADMSAKLLPYLEDKEAVGGLAHALKIVVNIVYGMTSAKFSNVFKDERNEDNCVAKRGALFMIQLRKEVESMGYTVAHIKTDSIKIPNGDQRIIDYCMRRAKEYGYEFEHEHTYSRMALVNNAVLIAQISYPEKEAGKWEAVGKQFAEPFVYKALFDREEIVEEDFPMLYQVKKGAIYLDDKFIGKNAHLYPSISGHRAIRKSPTNVASSVWVRYNKPVERYLPQRDILGATESEIEGRRVARIAKEVGIRIDEVEDIITNNRYEYIIDKDNALSGTSNHKWRSWEDYRGIDDVDMSYYQTLVNDAVDDIYRVGNGNIFFTGTQYERE